MWFVRHSPPFQRRGARGIKSLKAEGGVVSKRSRSLLICPRSAPYFCWNLLTTPSAPLRNGIFLLRRSHPSLKTEGNGACLNSPLSESYLGQQSLYQEGNCRPHTHSQLLSAPAVIDDGYRRIGNSELVRFCLPPASGVSRNRRFP